MTTLTPPEHLALITARAQLGRGENPGINTTTALVMTIERMDAVVTELSAVIPPGQFRKLADWFDEDDRVKMMLREEDPTLPATWVSRGTETQEDLRRFADLLDGAV